MKAKSLIFSFLFIALLLPALQYNFYFFRSAPLSGYYDNAPNTNFTFGKWWDGSYQEEKTKYIEDSFGFRAELIHLTCQADYSLLGKLHSSHGVVEGGHHNLFINNYTDSYFGRDFIGYDRIHDQLRKLKAIQDTLQRMGKSLIVVYTPSKEYMYPEDIPKYLRSTRRVTNSQVCRQYGDSIGLHQVDFNAWFCSLKGHTGEVLYTKQGIHWSVYSSWLAADSFVNYVERLRCIHMVHPIITGLEHSQTPRENDADIEGTLNLVKPITTETLTYPVIRYTSDATAARPRAVYLGDSFLLMWMNEGLMGHINSNWVIWQEMKGLWDQRCLDEHTFGRTLADYDFKGAIQQADYLVLMYTTSNLSELGNGFIDKAYAFYYPRSASSR